MTIKGKVVANVEEITLQDCTFYVCESTRVRCIERRRREVHAWAQGIVTDAVPTGKREAITYNPYRASTFTTRGGTPVTACDFIHFTTNDGAIAITEFK